MTSLNKYRDWLRNIKPVVVKKKQATQKQINALAKARAAHQANTLARWAAEAKSRLPAGTDFNTENYIKKVKDIAAAGYFNVSEQVEFNTSSIGSLKYDLRKGKENLEDTDAARQKAIKDA